MIEKTPAMIRIKRIYEKASPEDGCRVLVDRLWPRGVSKEEAAIHTWMREVAPSDALRKWFGKDTSKWEEFARRYMEELDDKLELLQALKALEKEHGTLTLLYAKNDEVYNNANVLKGVLEAL